MDISLEKIRPAERELARRDLVEAGGSTFKPIHHATHLLLQDRRVQVDRIRCYRNWMLGAIR